MRVNPNYLLKLKRILIPFAIVAWGTLLTLAFIRWWLFLDKHPILTERRSLAVLDSGDFSMVTDSGLAKTTV
jgi:hypothetical protein